MSETPRQGENEPVVGPDTLRPEHLAEGFRPIMACIGTKEQYGDDIAKIKDIEKVGQNVDYYADSETSRARGYRNAGNETYAISTIDEKPKFTQELYNCTSLIVVGRDISSGAELSFLTHQDPGSIHGSAENSFNTDLKERLEEFKAKCLQGSIDVVIAGGRFHTNTDYKYQKSLEVLNSIVKETLGFEPTVISGPKSGNRDNIYFDTANRNLYVIRPEGKEIKPVLHNDPFKPSDIENMKKKWGKEEGEHDPFGWWNDKR